MLELAIALVASAVTIGVTYFLPRGCLLHRQSTIAYRPAHVDPSNHLRTPKRPS